MKANKKIAVSIIALAIFVVLLFTYVLPFISKVYTGLAAYETRVAYRDDYALHTTPLSVDTVHEICLKLNIEVSSEHCESGAIVYAPDLFDEIKTYFRNLDDQDRTYYNVQEKLGPYLDYCVKPDPNGSRTCIYDLQGDGVYPIFFDFDKNGFYYQIIANTGGS
jgi:hypothetical protein